MDKSSGGQIVASSIVNDTLKLADVLTISIAAVSLVVVAITMFLIIYFFFKVRDDASRIARIEEKIRFLEGKFDEGDYVSDRITNVLYDLYRLISGVKGFVELSDMGYKVDDRLFDLMESDISHLEKHFAELGLMSVDKERRLSAQQSLVNLTGDFRSLEIMQDIERRRIGIYDAEIEVSIRKLKEKIGRTVVHSSAWTGRPSGQAF